MNQQKFLKIEIPLVDYIQPDKSVPKEIPFRLRPIHSLDLKFLKDRLETSTIATKDINGNPWSVISVYSPYSVDFHVMLMETGMRYLPSPEYVNDNEAKDLMDLWIKIIQFMKDTYKDQRILVGYNWSPRSWGEIEEAGGFQSIPTKWHPMFWTWPEFNEDSQLPYLSWENYENLEIPFKRMNGENHFVAPIAKRIKKEADGLIKEAFEKKGIIKTENSIADQNGFCVTFKCGLKTLLSDNDFFTGFLKPLSISLNYFFSRLTEIFLDDYKSSDIDEILKKTANGRLDNSDTGKLSWGNPSKFYDNDLYDIRFFPPLKDEEIIRNSLKELYFKPEAIDELVCITKNREKYAKFFDKIKNELLEEINFDKKAINEIMSEVGSRSQDKLKLPAWRKGFAYALVLEELKDMDNNEVTKLKIVPAAYLGSGGVVEATGVVLKRPENAKLPPDQCLIKSQALYPLINIINPHCNLSPTLAVAYKNSLTVPCSP